MGLFIANPAGYADTDRSDRPVPHGTPATGRDNVDLPPEEPHPVAIPVTDVDRAKALYVEQVGFHADHDHQVNEALRFVQLTPPGSACSVVLGTGVTDMSPGSQKGCRSLWTTSKQPGGSSSHGGQASDVDVQPWGSFVTFSDPDCYGLVP
jgi:catechol 2,3-dioxygenase-like lactoylglutathione lyase family enzyme